MDNFLSLFRVYFTDLKELKFFLHLTKKLRLYEIIKLRKILPSTFTYDPMCMNANIMIHEEANFHFIKYDIRVS